MAKRTAAELKLLKKMLAELDDEELEELRGSDRKSSRGTANFKTGPRPNTFAKSADAKKFKADSKIDKQLWGDNEREERTKLVKIEANCTKCNRKYKVNPILAYKDDTDRKWYFICDNCVK